MKPPLPDNARLIPKNAKRVFKGKVFDTYQWQQKLYDGSKTTFEMLKRPDTVIILGVVGDDKVIIIEQEQPSKPKHWSLPAGRVDESEEPLDAAKREMEEETGYTFANWKLVDIDQVHTKFEWFVYFYVAQSPLKKIKQNLDAGEKIEVHEVSYSKVVEHIKSRDIKWGEPLIKTVLQGREKLSDVLSLPEIN